jgi:hypothetical protein
MDNHHEKLMAISRSRKCRGHDGGLSRKTGCHGFGGNSRRNRVQVEHQEVPKEEGAVETTGVLESRYGD